MVKQEHSPELPVDPLATSSAMAAAAATMTTPPLLGLSPLSRLPIPHQVSLGTMAGLRERGPSRSWVQREQEAAVVLRLRVRSPRAGLCLLLHCPPP